MIRMIVEIGNGAFHCRSIGNSMKINVFIKQGSIDTNRLILIFIFNPVIFVILIFVILIFIIGVLFIF